MDCAVLIIREICDCASKGRDRPGRIDFDRDMQIPLSRAIQHYPGDPEFAHAAAEVSDAETLPSLSAIALAPAMFPRVPETWLPRRCL